MLPMLELPIANRILSIHVSSLPCLLHWCVSFISVRVGCRSQSVHKKGSKTNVLWEGSSGKPPISCGRRREFAASSFLSPPNERKFLQHWGLRSYADGTKEITLGDTGTTLYFDFIACSPRMQTFGYYKSSSLHCRLRSLQLLKCMERLNSHHAGWWLGLIWAWRQGTQTP